MSQDIKLTAQECALRERLISIAEQFSSSPECLSKEQIRVLHSGKRIDVMASMNGSFSDQIALLREHLADPCEIDISKIKPHLSIVMAGTQDSRLFNAASLLWSVPVSKGFGRRMRYLVKDKRNGKLIGIIGLTDPVFNLTPRDAWVGWNADDRAKRLIHTMDAFALGALPPYNKILGGKLVALLATSSNVVTDFRKKYRDYKGVISKKGKNPRLVLLTTSSALGRSSLYNRLRIPKSVAFLTGVENDRVPTWYTRGYGHFHIPESTFEELQSVLARRDHPYASGNRFGDGPNWRIRVIRRAAVELGVKFEILQHGIRRQVYIVPLASNAREVLLGTDRAPVYITKSIPEIVKFWRKRWAAPRSKRFPEWRNWNAEETIADLHRLHAIANKNRIK